MLKDKRIENLKKEYMNIDTSDRLDEVVNNAIKNKKRNNRWIYTAASFGLIVCIVNINSSFANTLQNIPVIGNFIKIINFSNYKIDENGLDVDIKYPKLEGLNNDIEYKLNKEFESHGKTLYKEYLEEAKKLKEENSSTHKMVKSWYEVKTDNEKILSIAVYTDEIQASSYRTAKYYNIDKENKTVLTLEGIFNNKDYIKVISENIKQQMKERMKNKDKHYWLNDEFVDNFDSIDKDQSFYINNKNELVISFDKYEVSPGYMGSQEFIIPNKLIKSLL